MVSGMARHPSSARRVALALTLLILTFFAPAAFAQIVPQRGIKGIRLEMTVREVRDRLGTPDRITFEEDPIQGRVQVYAYGLTRASFSSGDNARVTAISTTSRRERTSRGVGVGSARTTVARKVPGVRCRVEYGFDHCYIGSLAPGTRATDFLIGSNGRVRRVVVGIVID